jgi:hypothetical protein
VQDKRSYRAFAFTAWRATFLGACAAVYWETNVGIAEIFPPGYTPPNRVGNVAVAVRIVSGRFKIGRAQLRSSNGEIRDVSLYGMAAWPDGRCEAFIGGATEMDIQEGQLLIQGTSTDVEDLPCISY